MDECLSDLEQLQMERRVQNLDLNIIVQISDELNGLFGLFFTAAKILAIDVSRT